MSGNSCLIRLRRVCYVCWVSEVVLWWEASGKNLMQLMHDLVAMFKIVSLVQAATEDVHV